MSFTNIDLTNMMRGEGEWKNMQEIVRRTLKICFEQMDKQSEQIASLVGQVGSLKSQLSNKVNRDEVDLIIKAHMKTINSTNAVAPSKTHVTKAEYDKLKEQLIQVRNDIERKASIRYVDECMHRKIDRSDLLVKNLQTFSAAQYSSQLTQLFQDLTDTKAQVDSISRATSDMQKDMQGAQDLHVVKNQMEAIYRSMSDYYTKNHINALLDQKQDVAGLDSILFKKVEASTLQAATSRIEAALESHEKALTSLRLKLNDSSLFEARNTLARNSAQPLFCSESSRPCTARRCKAKRRSKATGRKGATDGGVSSGYESAESTGSCRCNNAEIGGGHTNSSKTTSAASTSSNTARNRRLGDSGFSGVGEGANDVESVLRDGRVQALVEGLWIKVDNAEVVTLRLKQELEGFRGAMSRIEATLSQVAGSAQMETLALVVEEQRQRIDSILTGSTPIDSITEEFQRQQGDISDIQDFLQLPQHKPLRAQLQEAGELMDVLSHRVAELGTALGRAGIKIEAVEVVHRQLETRLQVAENTREKIMHLHSTTDLSETEFASVKDIARRLAALSQAVVGESATTTAIASLNKKQPPLCNRLQSLESEATATGDGIKQLDVRLKELKQIVTTVGFTSATGPTMTSSTSRSSDHDRRHDASASASSNVIGRTSAASTGPRTSSPQRDYLNPSSPSSSPNRRGNLRNTYSYSNSNTSTSVGREREQQRVDMQSCANVGGPSPASPLRSPSMSPARSPPKSALRASGSTANHSNRVRLSDMHNDIDSGAGAGAFSPVGQPGGEGAGPVDLDSSRLSVDFELALEQMLTSIHQDAATDAPVPVQELPAALAGVRVNNYRPVSAAASAGAGVGRSAGSSRAEVTYGGAGRGAGAGVSVGIVGSGVGRQSSTSTGTSSSVRISSLQRVDDRLLELKQEKERLRRLLMDRVEDL